jgi:hypothetical protein
MSIDPEGPVVTRLLGGLGNQLFQYATARALAARSGLPLKLDLSALQGHRPQRYGLAPFAIAATEATPDEIRGLRRGPDLLLRIAPRLAGRHVLVERHFHFDPTVLRVRGPAYLSGYWQSERYFADADARIRAELVVKAAPADQNEATLRAIRSRESVAVHVRRGDYVSNPRTHRIHGTCSLDYYQRAIAEIRQRVKEPHLFVFSDDGAWARRHLDTPLPVTFVDHNGPDRGHEDLRLMAACRHHVIANSSFSWWGAWLARHPGQHVIAPARWFAAARHRTSDLYPDGWTRI